MENISFGIKLNTAEVLEVTTQKVFQSEGLSGCKRVLEALGRSRKATGWQGYKYLAQQTGEKITSKYPELADATSKINLIYKNNPDIKKQDAYKKIQPIINDIGQEIDIVI